MRNILDLVLLTTFAAHLFSQTQSKSLTCGTCHTDVARTQPATPMARALLLPAHNDVLRDHPKLQLLKNGYTYTVTTDHDASTYTVSDGVNTISAPIRWSFGAGAQTWVLEHDGNMYESLVSYYPLAHGLDTTVGDQVIQPKTILEAFGRELATTEITGCFGCHSSSSVVDHSLHLDTLHEGVTCDHCHNNAAAHLQAISHGKLIPLPPKLKGLGAEDVSSFCGQCHRTWGTVVRNHWFGEMNVRFQPYRLANSKCFDGTDQRISCVACHDPHQQLVVNQSTYDTKCFACHANVSSSAAKAKAPACPVAKSNCASCHMPKVSLPGGHQIFTDHDIRVVKADEPYPN